jgi:hypothetical protein
MKYMKQMYVKESAERKRTFVRSDKYLIMHVFLLHRPSCLSLTVHTHNTLKCTYLPLFLRTFTVLPKAHAHGMHTNV